MSRQSLPILSRSIKAVGAIVANRFVTPVRDQAVADENTLGVSRSAAADGEMVTIDVLGTTTIESGAAFAEGATLKSDASGRAITWATAGGRAAIALEPATAAGQFIEVLLLPNAA